MASRVGFIGFGEVASVFSEAVSPQASAVLAYDVLVEKPAGKDLLRKRDRTNEVRFVGLPELVAGSDWIVSTVTSDAAAAVARSAAPYLGSARTFLDLNATAPAVKQQIARTIEPTGAAFVEGAILSAVGVTGARTRILIGDSRGPAATEALGRLGLNAVFYSREIGRASAFKLLRSIFSKGLEALLIEFLVAGRRAGLEDELWREVTELFARNPFAQVAENWIKTHATAHERRYHEVVQVAAEMRALGLDPVMTAATEAFFARSRTTGLKERFAGTDATPADVIAFLESALRAAEPSGSPPQALKSER
ncbi:MAG: DUF1932 domain-containing protein [Opitutaceae bacterium]|nr:DUF1932 domain-containing protein [Opitutaceae bacterium]